VWSIPFAILAVIQGRLYQYGHDLTPHRPRPRDLLFTNWDCLDVEPLGRLGGQHHALEVRPLDWLDVGG